MGNRKRQVSSKRKQVEQVSTSAELQARASAAFNAALKKAADLLWEAMQLKGADGIHLSLVGARVQGGLSWDEREVEGEMQSDGTIQFGRKP